MKLGERYGRRRGVFLYAALGLAVMVILFAATYYAFMRRQTRQAHRILQGEIAYHLAQAGVAAGIAYFANTAEPGPLYNVLISSDSQAANDAAPETFTSADHPILEALLLPYGDDVELEVELDLMEFQPFLPSLASTSGVEYRGIEKEGTLKITARARHGGVRKTLVCFKPVRVLATLPYVVSKFTFFEATAPGTSGALNRTRYLKTGMRTGRRADDDPLAPLELFHGPAGDPEERGWVFLGGGERVFNLTWGREGLGEEFQMLSRPWKISYDPSAPGSLSPGYVMLMMQKGFFQGIQADNDLFDNYDFQAPAGDPVGEECTWLHLFGTADDPSTTYVLGQVLRRYLSLRYIQRLSDGKYTYIPWSDLARFNSPPPSPYPSPPPFDVKSDVFSSNFGLFAYAMSDVITESYNRSADYVANDPETLEPDRNWVGPERVKHRFSLDDFLYRPDFNIGEVRVFDDGGEPLFDGQLAQISMADMLLTRRASYVLPADRFPDFLDLGLSKLPGIVYFEGGPLVIDRPVQFDSGGILAAEESIVIRDRVGTSSGGRPLVLASEKGSIHIETSAPLQVSLVALNGTITGNGSGLDLTGNLAAGSIDLGRLLSPSSPSRVVYDPRLDVTDTDNRVYSVTMGPQREMYLQ